MAPLLTPTVRSALEGGNLAHLVTLNEDGSPQVTVVWVGLDGDELVMGHLDNRKKVRNIRRDPRVTISLETGGLDDRGLAQYLVVNGVARVSEGGAPELLQRLAHVFLGPDVRFPPMDDPPGGYIVHITPESIGGIGPWAQTG
jgi:PPOX class probable F420-dependent enzyme